MARIRAPAIFRLLMASMAGVRIVVRSAGGIPPSGFQFGSFLTEPSARWSNPPSSLRARHISLRLVVPPKLRVRCASNCFQQLDASHPSVASLPRKDARLLLRNRRASFTASSFAVARTTVCRLRGRTTVLHSRSARMPPLTLRRFIVSQHLVPSRFARLGRSGLGPAAHLAQPSGLKPSWLTQDERPNLSQSNRDSFGQPKAAAGWDS